jgi:hypothetical protein
VALAPPSWKALCGPSEARPDPTGQNGPCTSMAGRFEDDPGTHSLEVCGAPCLEFQAGQVAGYGFILARGRKPGPAEHLVEVRAGHRTCDRATALDRPTG